MKSALLDVVEGRRVLFYWSGQWILELYDPTGVADPQVFTTGVAGTRPPMDNSFFDVGSKTLIGSIGELVATRLNQL